MSDREFTIVYCCEPNGRRYQLSTPAPNFELARREVAALRARGWRAWAEPMRVKTPGAE